MRQPLSEPELESLIGGARSAILEWLRDGSRDPHFLTDRSESDLATSHAQIADRFLFWCNRCGFEAQLVEIQKHGVTALEVRWTHNRAEFVGFKQAPPAKNPADALLLGCAALLQNDWCRKQLQKL